MSKLWRSMAIVLLLVLLVSPVSAAGSGEPDAPDRRTVVELVEQIWDEIKGWISKSSDEFGEIIEPNG